MQKYTPQFYNVYRHSGSQLNPDVWYRMVGKNLRAFQNPSNVYLPVTLNVRLSNRADGGAAKIQVSPADQIWYEKLEEAVKHMCEITTSNKQQIQIQTYMGQPIRNMSYEQLENVGELFVVDAKTGAPIVHPENRIKAPPKHMSADKLQDIVQWHQDTLRDGVVNVVANELKHLDKQEIDPALVRNGRVQQAIASFIESSAPDGDWNAFLDTYARDETARAINTADGGHEAAQAIARGYLQQIRSGIRANKAHVKTFFAQKEAERIAGHAEEDRPLFAEHTATGVSKFADAGVMWREIAEDAMYRGQTTRIPVACVYDGHKRVCPAPGKRLPPSVTNKMAVTATKNPLERLQVNSPLAAKAYKGDSNRAVDMYHLFSGRAFPSRVACHGKPMSRKGKKGKKKSRSPSPVEARVGGKMPELVPIVGAVTPMPKLVPIAGAVTDKPMPKLVPIASAVTDKPMPKLVPIASAVTEKRMPELVPIRSSIVTGELRNVPELVDIGARHKSRRRSRSRSRKEKDKKDRDIGDPLATFDLDEPLFEAGFDDAPSMDDFLL